MAAVRSQINLPRPGAGCSTIRAAGDHQKSRNNATPHIAAPINTPKVTPRALSRSSSRLWCLRWGRLRPICPLSPTLGKPSGFACTISDHPFSTALPVSQLRETKRASTCINLFCSCFKNNHFYSFPRILLKLSMSAVSRLFPPRIQFVSICFGLRRRDAPEGPWRQTSH